MRSMNDDLEYLRPPEEFPPPAEQTAPPPPEFGEAGQSASPVRKKRKHHWLAAAVAAGLLSTVALFSDVEKAILEQPFVSPTPFAVVAAATPTSSPALDHTPSPSPVPTAAATPTPEPTFTPEPTPEEPEELQVELVFFNFSAYHKGFVRLSHQDAVKSVLVEIIETNFDSVEWSAEVPEEKIAGGYYQIPTFDDSDTYFKYMDQYEKSGLYIHLSMRATLTVEGESGPETLVYTKEASEEQGWSTSYWPDDYTPVWSGEAYYPGCFAVTSYEALDDFPDMRMGDYDDADQNGGICVSLEINDVPVPKDNCIIAHFTEPTMRYDPDRDEYVETGRYLYYTMVIIPRPDSAPLSGTAKYTICQKLTGYDLVWITQRTQEYGTN